MNTFKFTLVLIFIHNVLARLGDIKTINCFNQTKANCYQGTLDCHDDSSTYCHLVVGNTKTISCFNKTYTTCPEGTLDCHDDSLTYCKKG